MSGETVECDDCLQEFCCTEMVNCDVGTPCFDLLQCAGLNCPSGTPEEQMACAVDNCPGGGSGAGWDPFREFAGCTETECSNACL